MNKTTKVEQKPILVTKARGAFSDTFLRCYERVLRFAALEFAFGLLGFLLDECKFEWPILYVSHNAWARNRLGWMNIHCCSELHHKWKAPKVEMLCTKMGVIITIWSKRRQQFWADNDNSWSKEEKENKYSEKKVTYLRSSLFFLGSEDGNVLLHSRIHPRLKPGSRLIAKRGF